MDVIGRYTYIVHRCPQSKIRWPFSACFSAWCWRIRSKEKRPPDGRQLCHIHHIMYDINIRSCMGHMGPECCEMTPGYNENYLYIYIYKIYIYTYIYMHIVTIIFKVYHIYIYIYIYIYTYWAVSPHDHAYAF